MRRPESHEFHPFFTDYINLVPDGEVRALLEKQANETVEIFSNLTKEQELHRYAPDKWSLKQVLGHMIDTERVMSYRLLCASRGDEAPLPGFNENHYVDNAGFEQLAIEHLIEEYRVVRKSTLMLINGMTEEAWGRSGYANNHSVTARALVYTIAGHELHHMKIVKERYLETK